MSLGLPQMDTKKVPGLCSPTSSSSSSASHPVSPRTPGGTSGSGRFATPTFNLNALQSYPHPQSLSPLLSTLPRDLVGSLYTSFTSRALPVMPCPPSSSGLSIGPSSGPSSGPSGRPSSGGLLSPTKTSSAGGGFHSSLPPTVTTSASSSSTTVRPTDSKTSTSGKSTLRPLVPRKSVTNPPPLVPIRTNSGRTPPVLLPIMNSAVVESSVAVEEDASPEAPPEAPPKENGRSPTKSPRETDKVPQPKKKNASSAVDPDSKLETATCT